MKKKALISALLAVCVMLSACGLVSQAKEAVTALTPVATEQVESGIVSVTPTPAPATPTPEPTEAIPALTVTARDTDCSGEYTDSVGNTIQYSYSLPAVSGSSGYAGAVNVELDGIYSNFVEPELADMENGVSLVTTDVGWRCAEFNGITSLLVIVRNDWGCNSYYVYNFFTADGTKASNEDVFAALGITADDFTAAASAKLAQQVDFSDVTDADENAQAIMQDVHDRTLSAENCSAEMPLYITECGTICFIGRVYSVAGADYYDHFFVLAPDSGFSDEELCELSLDYYETQNGIRPGMAAADSSDENAIVIQLYDQLEDHNSTADWYTVTRDGTGTDSQGHTIDLTVD